jgi:hypothetical protein
MSKTMQMHSVLHSFPVLQNTLRYADGRPDSAALSRPNSVRFLGEMGLSVRTAARRISGFEHLAHPSQLQNWWGGFCLDTEPETMTHKTTGLRAVAPSKEGAPSHYLRRVARSIVIRAALRGRLSWHVALPMLSKIGGAA